MTTTLVTGGAGFVGLNVAELLLGRGEHVVLADVHPPPAAATEAFGALSGRLDVARLDVSDAAAVRNVMSNVKPARVVHMAAITAGANRDAREPRRIAEVNFLGTLNVIEAAKDAEVGRFVYTSTGALYGAAGRDVPHELDEVDDRPVPDTMYGITKYASERSVLRLGELWNLDVVVGRLGMVYGRWEHDTGLRDTLSPLGRVMQMAKDGERAVFRDLGAQDWIYAIDVARAILAIADAPAHASRVYHLGAAAPFKLTDWCALLARRFPKFEYATSPNPSAATVPGIAPTVRTPFSTKRLREGLGFRIEYPIEKALDDYLAWSERHADFMRGAR